MTSYCDPDECLYSDTPTLRLDGCDEKVCREHEQAEIVPWNDGVDSGWLHARGTCTECDGFWTDVDVNTAFYAEKSHGVTAPVEPAPSLVAAKGQEPA